MMFYRTGLPSKVRITHADYRKMVSVAKKIKAAAKKKEYEGIMSFNPSLFPTEDELEDHYVKYSLRKYLPYLVYYREPDIYESDGPEFEKTREYINSLFDRYVVFMEDRDCAGIRRMDPDTWAGMSAEERAAVLAPVISYYSRNEFSAFCRDLGWLPFMKYARLSRRKFQHDGGINKRIRNDLEEIWDIVQNA